VSRRLVLASANRHKVLELRAMIADRGLPLTVATASELGPAPVVPEDEGSFVAHARRKARDIAAWLRGREEPGETLVLADDSGICIDALDGAPGVDSAVYAGPQADSDANNARMVAELARRGLDRSPAHYVCVLALTRVDAAPLPPLPGADPGPEPSTALFSARWHGEIRRERRGLGGFGYDPHVWVTSAAGECTVAELPEAEKNARSHRGQAFARLVAALPRLLA
jgi:XTP/dITP diphosphohydrolase